MRFLVIAASEDGVAKISAISPGISPAITSGFTGEGVDILGEQTGDPQTGEAEMIVEQTGEVETAVELTGDAEIIVELTGEAEIIVELTWEGGVEMTVEKTSEVEMIVELMGEEETLVDDDELGAAKSDEESEDEKLRGESCNEEGIIFIIGTAFRLNG